jgi:branched-chain amino acid transport system ATP-binding protein
MLGRLRAITGDAPATPLLVLFGLNFVDELDRLAFGVMAPEIGETFGIDDGDVVVISTLVAIAAVAAVLPVSYLADRFNRVRLVAFAAMSWMSLSVLTGLAGWAGVLALLIVARLGAGIGRAVNEPVHSSLLPDYYEAERLPRVFAFHRVANPVSSASAIGLGALGAVLGWQALFILLAIPTGLLILSTLRLHHPNRGTMIDAELAAEAEAQGAVPFAEARRQLFGIKALKRLYIGGFLLGFGVFPLAIFTIFFFENVFGYDAFGRGVVTAVSGVGLFAGLVVGERAVARHAITDTGKLALLTGLAFMLGGAGLLLMALSPFSVLALVLVFIANIGFSAYLPPYLTLIALIVPPKVRTQAFGYSLILVAAGGLLSAIIFGNLGDTQGYRMAIGIMSTIVILAGLVGSTASRFVAGDVESATRSLSAAREMQAAKAAGGGSLLVCRGVEVAYDQVQVLFGVDMDVRPGECVALLGTNGAGKSTLLKAISGTVDPIGGAIYFDGRDISHADGAQTTALGVIQVPGGKAVFPTLTVAEHLRAAGWLYRDDPAYLKAATDDVLQTFPRLRERIDQMAGNLSGGEQQMLALGMAFIAKPKLLMIDELSLGLAPTIVEQLLGIVRRIQESGTAIILVEQSINVALTVADRAYFLEKGEVRFEGATEELLERNDIVRSVFLEGGGAKAKVKAGAGPATSEVIRTAPTELERILELDAVTKRFGGITAVDDASFVLHRGEILGLIGPNGAGKTTIFDLISGFLTANHGQMTFEGQDITTMAPDRRAWLGLGRSFQDARLAGSLTVAENIAIGLERHLDVRDHLASMLNLPGVARQEEDVAWTVADLIELMHLGAFRDKFVRELSTGTRRIVDLAMCLGHDPSVLLLDEPSSGIAQAETEALGPLLQRIQVETGCALLVIEHDMPLITAVSDRMIALELGHPIAEGSPQEVISHPRVVESYLGGDPAAINRSGRPAPAPIEPEPTSTRKAAARRARPAPETGAAGAPASPRAPRRKKAAAEATSGTPATSKTAASSKTKATSKAKASAKAKATKAASARTATSNGRAAGGATSTEAPGQPASGNGSGDGSTNGGRPVRRKPLTAAGRGS